MNDTQRVDLELEVAEEMVAARDAFFRMASTPEYKLIFDKMYFKDEAARLAMACVNPGLDERQQRNMDNMLKGPGVVFNFFNSIVSRGNAAEQSIDEHNSEEDSE